MVCKQSTEKNIKGMILPRRQEARIEGDTEYFTNPNESIHKILKQGITAKTTIIKFKEHYDKECGIMLRNIERSVCGQGPFKVIPKFRENLQVSNDAWKSLSANDREKKIMKIWKVPKGLAVSSDKSKVAYPSKIKLTHPEKVENGAKNLE